MALDTSIKCWMSCLINPNRGESPGRNKCQIGGLGVSGSSSSHRVNTVLKVFNWILLAF